MGMKFLSKLQLLFFLRGNDLKRYMLWHPVGLNTVHPINIYRVIMYYFVVPIQGLILGLCPANERRRYFATISLIGWVQA